MKPIKKNSGYEKVSLRTRKTVFTGMLSSLSLGLFALESAIPPLTVFPGIKPGIANAVTLFILFRAEFQAGRGGFWFRRDAVTVMIVRVLLSAFAFAQPMTLLYSFSGGIAALCGEILFMRLRLRKIPPGNPAKGSAGSVIATSIVGALLHVSAQTAVAAAVLGSGAVFAYLPFMAAGAAICGTFTGAAVAAVVKQLNIEN
ncbi:heptaprenyl diphosphate synthase subunit I [Clostridia bacterium]|nr:heptaprenyl diphosphate synthase subunit I [Clostridia bacterium]